MAVRLMVMGTLVAGSAVAVTQDDFVTWLEILEICSLGDDNTSACKKDLAFSD